jgi:hypothetical protein
MGNALGKALGIGSIPASADAQFDGRTVGEGNGHETTLRRLHSLPNATQPVLAPAVNTWSTFCCAYRELESLLQRGDALLRSNPAAALERYEVALRKIVAYGDSIPAGDAHEAQIKATLKTAWGVLVERATRVKMQAPPPGAVAAAALESGGGGGGGGAAGSAFTFGAQPRPRFCSVPANQRHPDRELIEQLEREILDAAPNVHFREIAGLDTCKKLLQEAVVLPQICPTYFTGVREPWKGVLLFGPPGTGKTLLAKAVATECRTTFMSVSAATLGSKWRGESEKLVKVLFELAAYYAPTVLFFDEIDSIARKRCVAGRALQPPPPTHTHTHARAHAHAHHNRSENDDETSRRVKTELLTAMDGLKARGAGSVMVLGATNRPDELDDAFLRRFEKRVHIPLPSPEDREVLLRLKLGAIADKSVDFKAAARQAKGYSGADLAVVCKSAAFKPGRRKEAELKKRYPKPEQNLQYLQALGQALEHASPPVLHEDLVAAFAENKPSATKASLALYEKWEDEHGAA